MRVFVTDCGGLLGPPLIRWLLASADVVVGGSDAHHERLEDLLGAPGFSFYVVAGEGDAQLVGELLDHADVVVCLGGIEHPLAGEGDAEERRRGRAALVRACVATEARLVYVSSAEVPAPVLPATSGVSTLRDVADVAVNGEAAELELQQLILAYGISDQLDHVIVRTFDVFDDRLEVLPVRRPSTALTATRDALLAGTDAEIPLNDDDLAVRACAYVEDIAECIGRIVLDQSGRTTGTVIDAGHPGNWTSLADLARLVVRRYRRQYWDGSAPLPVIPDSLRPEHGEEPLMGVEPNPLPARQLLGWRPRWSLTSGVDAALHALHESER